MVHFGELNNIINTGNSDNIILANEELKKKIKNLEKSNNSLIDLEKTHITYLTSNFKPYISTTSEYIIEKIHNKIELNSNIEINISQLGDFFHDMVLHVVIGYENNINSYIYFNDDVSINNIPKYKFCNHPGERLIKKCNFSINGDILDEYNTEDITFWKEFNLNDDQKNLWDKLVGQENGLKGISKQNISLLEGDEMQTSYIERAFENDNNYKKTNFIYNKELSTEIGAKVYNGYQTPKYTHKELDLWIPLIFWFNKDVGSSFPSIALPYGNRSIEFTLCSENELVGLIPSEITNKNYMVSLDSSSNLKEIFGEDYDLDDNKSINNILIYDEKKYNNKNIINNIENCFINPLKIKTFELYVNNIFIDPKLHEIFVKRIGFSLIRTYKQQVFISKQNYEEFHLNELKWPIETIYLGMKMAEYETPNTLYFDVWNRFGFLPEYTNLYHKNPFHNNNKFKIDCSLNYENIELNTFDSISYREYNPIIDSISLISQDVKLMDNFPYRFYTQYIPWKYNIDCEENTDNPLISEKLSSKSHIQKNTEGLSMISFALYPGNSQPSGYINVSRAKDFYISYNSSIIGTPTNWWSNKNCKYNKPQGNLYVSAIALNFLLIENGNYILRFSR